MVQFSVTEFIQFYMALTLCNKDFPLHISIISFLKVKSTMQAWWVTRAHDTGWWPSNHKRGVWQKAFLTVLIIFTVRNPSAVLLPTFLPTLGSVGDILRLIFLRLTSHHSIPLLLIFYITSHCLITKLTFLWKKCKNL